MFEQECLRQGNLLPMDQACTVTIDAGICGFVTTVRADSEDGQMVVLDIQTDCENIKKLANALSAIDAYEEIGAGFDGRVLGSARTILKGCCSGCVVPNGIFKAVQVAASLALPATSKIQMEQP